MMKSELQNKLRTLADKYECASFCDQDPSQFLKHYKNVSDATVADTEAKQESVPTNAKVITFFSPKGGAGKTSIATSVAYGIAKYLKKKVLLMDLDLQFGGIAFMLQLKTKKTIVDLTETGALRTFDDIKSCLVKHSSGFDLLPAPIKPEQSENVDSNHLRKIITLSKDQFDYIIIDTHSLLQDMSINALDLSDIIMLVMNPDMGHIMAVHNCLKVMDSLKYPKEKIHLVLNKFGNPTSLPKEQIDGAMQKDNVKVNYVVHEDGKVVSNLINNSKTVFDDNEKSDYRNDIATMISDVTKEKLPPEAGQASSGIFGAIVNWFNS